MNNLRNITKILSTILSALFLLSPLSTSAVAVGDKGAINRDTTQYADSGPCGDLVGAEGGDTESGSKGIWNSGLQPPYILEQWAIEVLKDIAKKKGVEESKTVTKEHVIALVAFALGEGGDIMNDSVFNPLNTGLNNKDLLAGENDASGRQAFKSFDAGVEGTARTMVGSNQNRLANVLINPNSTAKQFMYALTYFNKYKGNQLWAEASAADPSGYYRGRLSLIKQVRGNYDDIAGLVIGTNNFEQADRTTKKSLLKFEGGGADPGGGEDCESIASGDLASIVEMALKLSWTENRGLTAKPEYKEALKKYNKEKVQEGADCGVFVATVMHASRADPNYPDGGTALQEEYVRENKDKYDVVDTVDSISDLKPGDILIVNSGSGEGGLGHTYIYVGPQGKNKYDQASASLNTRMPNLGKAVLGDQRGKYLRARLK